MPPVLLTPVANLPPVSLIPVAICHRVVDTGGKFAAGIVDTVANLPPVSTALAKMLPLFATGVVDTGGAP